MRDGNGDLVAHISLPTHLALVGVLVAGSLFLLGAVVSDPRTRWDFGTVAFCIVVGGISFGLSLPLVLQLLLGRTTLTVTDEGVVDNLTLTRWGLIPWDEIAKLKVESGFRGSLRLEITVRDKQRLAALSGRSTLWASFPSPQTRSESAWLG